MLTVRPEEDLALEKCTDDISSQGWWNAGAHKICSTVDFFGNCAMLGNPSYSVGWCHASPDFTEPPHVRKHSKDRRDFPERT